MCHHLTIGILRPFVMSMLQGIFWFLVGKSNSRLHSAGIQLHTCSIIYQMQSPPLHNYYVVDFTCRERSKQMMTDGHWTPHEQIDAHKKIRPPDQKPFAQLYLVDSYALCWGDRKAREWVIMWSIDFIDCRAKKIFMKLGFHRKWNSNLGKFSFMYVKYCINIGIDVSLLPHHKKIYIHKFFCYL